MRQKLLLILLAIVWISQVYAQGFQAKHQDDGVLITENGKKVLFYQKTPKSLDGKYERSNYIHPLYHLDGSILTEDFPADHYHHRGIFWTWHQVWIDDKRMGDAWLCEDFGWNVTDVTTLLSKTGNISIHTEIDWISPQWTDNRGNLSPFVKEKTKITLYPAQNNYRVIDFSIRLEALVENLSIGGSEDEKGYGGFSARIKLPEDIQFISTDGIVDPQTLAVYAGPWMDIQGTLKGNNRFGVTIMCHKNNPAPINDWILRRKNSMQNPVFPGNNPVKIPVNQPTELKYRMVIHDGSLSVPELKKIYRKYIQ